MNKAVYICAVVALCASLILQIGFPPERVAAEGWEPYYCHDFDSTSLDPGWTWVDPNDDGAYSLTERPGYLRLTCPPGDDFLPLTNLDAPSLMRSLEPGWYRVEMRMDDPSLQGGGGVVVWCDEQNHVILTVLESGLSVYWASTWQDTNRYWSYDWPCIASIELYIGVTPTYVVLDTIILGESYEWVWLAFAKADDPCYLGPFVTSDSGETAGLADIDYFRIWRDYQYDFAPPIITIVEPEDGGIYSSSTLPALSYTVTDDMDPDPTVTIDGWSTEGGTHTVTVTATDAAGNTASASATYTVEPLDTSPPTITIAAPTEGGIYSTSTLPALSYTVTDDTDPNPTANVTGWSIEEGAHTVTVTATDASGNSASQSVTYTVDNTAPTVSAVTADPNPVMLNAPINLTGLITDGGPSPSVTGAEYCIDGGPWQPMAAQDGAFDGASEAITAALSGFSETGVYNISIRGTDAAGNVSPAQSVLLAVYDPSAGFVTGGGWIQSPEGAYVPDGSLTGKANFGFVSKYQKGATVPTGQTQFQFKVGNLNFHSTSYDWLVIAGARAKYKGTGTINGSGEYGFMLTAVDSAINGGGDADAFRIKIWDKASDQVIYDNMLGLPDDDYGAQPLGGGSIVIHS